MTRILLTILLGLSFAMPAHAHRQPEVETTLEVVTEGGDTFLGITHRMHAHDAMTLLRALGEASPDLTDRGQLAALAVYAAGQLDLTGDAVSVPLGAEVEGNYVFVYVRHPEVAAVEGSTMLDGIIPGWTDTVHAKGPDGRTLRSLTFDADRTRLAEGEAPLLPTSGAGAAQ